MTDKLTTIAGRPVSEMTKDEVVTALSVAMTRLKYNSSSKQYAEAIEDIIETLTPKPIEDSLTYMGKPISSFTEEQAKAALAFVLINNDDAKCEPHQRKVAADRLYDLMNA